MQIKKNLGLLVGVLVPLLMVIGMAIAVYWPVWFGEKPQYDFVYSQNMYGSGYYKIENGKLTKPDIGSTNPDRYSSGFKVPDPYGYLYNKLYYHDTKRNQSREVTFEEAQQFKLDPKSISPDGFQLESNYSGSGFPFMMGHSERIAYLKKGSSTYKLNLVGDYYPEYRVIGWVIK